MPAICPPNDPPAFTIEINVQTRGAGSALAATFSAVPGDPHANLVQPNGDLDFHGYNQSIAMVFHLVDNSSLGRFFFNQGRYYVFSFSRNQNDNDNDADDNKLPIRPGHWQMQQPRTPDSMTATLCYHNADHGGDVHAPHSHRISRYGLFIGDQNNMMAPLSIDPAISNGGNDS